MAKVIEQIHILECQLFKNINKYFHRKNLHAFLHTITHCGGITFNVTALFLVFFFGSTALQIVALTSAISITISFIPVAICKKLYPRKRPYLVLDETNVVEKALKDYSFPSGHTTAIFSSVIPFVLFLPILSIVLIPLALAVGVSRIYLGLHYPTDVLVGLLLGSSTGMICFFIMKQFIPYVSV